MMLTLSQMNQKNKKMQSDFPGLRILSGSTTGAYFQRHLVSTHG